jgi:putative DNA primase/helicase
LKLWLGCNHRPLIRSTDHAIWRRVRLIPFTVTIAEQDQDRDLPAKLEAEWPGILAWAVRGCVDWQREGLGTPEAVRRATQDYRDEQDPLGAFIRERCYVDPTTSVGATPLYEAYVAWCPDAGEEPVSQTSFGKTLTERGFVKKNTKHGVSRLGVRLLEPGEQLGPGE